MVSTSDIARRYFAALAAHDLDAATCCWKPGAIDRLVGAQDLVAPEGIRGYFGELFGAFPNFELEVLELTTGRHRTAVRWRAHGTFAGPGSFQGFAPNHARLEIEGCDVVTVEDAGIEDMGPALRAVCAQHGGARRVVLGHGDPDHRGAAPALGAPTFCHPLERGVAEADAPLRDYWDMRKLRPYARPYFRRMLAVWDGGAVTIDGTVAEGDEVAGFEVVELPGHAPGLIGLFRKADRLALVSDCVYTLDIQTGRKGSPRVPHPAFDADVEGARASIRRLAALGPEMAWAGHADPVTGDVRRQLEQAAEAPL